MCSLQVLSKCVLQLGGLLIRVYGDHHGCNVRLSTLEALNELIKKVQQTDFVVEVLSLLLCRWGGHKQCPLTIFLLYFCVV